MHAKPFSAPDLFGPPLEAEIYNGPFLTDQAELRHRIPVKPNLEAQKGSCRGAKNSLIWCGWWICCQLGFVGFFWESICVLVDLLELVLWMVLVEVVVVRFGRVHSAPLLFRSPPLNTAGFSSALRRFAPLFFRSPPLCAALLPLSVALRRLCAASAPPLRRLCAALAPLLRRSYAALAPLLRRSAPLFFRSAPLFFRSAPLRAAPRRSAPLRAAPRRSSCSLRRSSSAL